MELGKKALFNYRNLLCFNCFPKYLEFRCRNPANYKVVVGDHNRNTNEGTEEVVGAKQIISHPQYNKPSPINNDIALIQLVKSVKLSQRVNTVCLPSHDSDVPTGSKCYITGKQGWKVRDHAISYVFFVIVLISSTNSLRSCRQAIVSFLL